MRKEFWIPSVLHLFVDFFCIYSLLMYDVTSYQGIIWFGVYNCLAFLLQPLFGALIEKSKKLQDLGSFGCALVILGTIISNFYSAVFLCGIGNALFHVTMGTVILNKSEKSSPLGVFISFGAIGVGLASSFSNAGFYYGMLLVFLAFTIWNIFTQYDFASYDFKKEFKADIKEDDYVPLITVIVLVGLGVLFRGFFGKYTNYTWSISYSILIVELAMFLGKFLGGFILDILGAVPLIIISLLLSLPTIFFMDNVYASLISIFGVNLLMALTMELIRRGMPDNLGLGFGLLAALLMTGTYLGDAFKRLDYMSFISPILMVINSITLTIAFFLLKKKGRISSPNLRFINKKQSDNNV